MSKQSVQLGNCIKSLQRPSQQTAATQFAVMVAIHFFHLIIMVSATAPPVQFDLFGFTAPAGPDALAANLSTPLPLPSQLPLPHSEQEALAILNAMGKADFAADDAWVVNLANAMLECMIDDLLTAPWCSREQRHLAANPPDLLDIPGGESDRSKTHRRISALIWLFDLRPTPVFLSAAWATDKLSLRLETVRHIVARHFRGDLRACLPILAGFFGKRHALRSRDRLLEYVNLCDWK